MPSNNGLFDNLVVKCPFCNVSNSKYKKNENKVWNLQL